MTPRSCVIIFLATLIITSSVSFAAADTRFPRPSELQPAIKFWTHVYSEIDTDHGFIHDNQHLNVVYGVISVPEINHPRKQRKQIKKQKQRYQNILMTLAKGKRNHLSPEQQHVLSLWPKDVSNKTLKAATNRLRFQRGQSNKFREGLIRSGAWRTFIEKTLKKNGVPKQLAALPHVESSFNPKAYSFIGASGIWQFTRATGRRYMRVDHVVDERLDPYKSTDAAARLLKFNYSATGTWPLAITGYNHGVAGLRRATRKLGTKDIGTIVKRYKGRSFGFASRNFYAAFLAAGDVERKAEKYFGPLKHHSPVRSVVVKAPNYLTIETLEKTLNTGEEEIKRLNASLRSPVWNGNKYVPKGFELRLPCNTSCNEIESALAKISPTEYFTAQKPDLRHKVRRGDSLSIIAARHKVRVKDLAEINALSSRHRIKVGQVLVLPQPQKPAPSVLASATDTLADAQQTDIYTVRSGDSLSMISAQLGVNEKDLLNVNHIDNRNRIYAGQHLKIASLPKESIEIQIPAPKQNTGEGNLPETSTPKIEDNLPYDNTRIKVAIPTETKAQESEAEETPLVTPTAEVPELASDPSDYTVTNNKSIEVQAAETLGHYAHWLEIRTQQLRNLNKLRFGKPVVVGKRLKLDFINVSPKVFEKRRVAHHRKLQSAFFEKYRITSTKVHVVKPGESLWILTRKQYDIPVWLLRQHNPDLNLGKVKPGMKVTFPSVEIRKEADETNPQDTETQAGSGMNQSHSSNGFFG